MRPVHALLLSFLSVPALAGANGMSPRVACGTRGHFDQIRANARLAPAGYAAALGGAKSQRDSFGTLPNVRTSANFALKWGSGAAYSETIATNALASLEEGWAVEIAQLGHPVPTGSETYLLNVYIGNSGNGAPDINFDGAYANVDGQGYPYIVLSPSITEYFGMPGYEGYAATTAVHELYHTVQFATDSFWEDDAYWFWEATADWASGEVYPDDESSYAFVGAWALYPHVAIDFADYADEGTLIELHQYGASIFPQFLTDSVANQQLIRDAWVGGGAAGDPLQVLDLLLDAHSTNIRDAFADFSARLALWDFERGDDYRSWAEYYADAYPSEDARVVDEVPRGGTSGWENAPAATRPAAFATNLIRILPSSDDVTVRVRYEEEGSQGSPSLVRAIVARRDGAAISYDELDADGEGELTGDVPGGADELWLVVTPLPASDMGVDETFAYEYRVDAGGGGGGGSGQPGIGCSVAAGDAAGSRISWLALLGPVALLIGLRRRRL